MDRKSSVQLLQEFGYVLKNKGKGFIVGIPHGMICPVCNVRTGEHKDHRKNPTQVFAVNVWKNEFVAVKCASGEDITYEELCHFIGYTPPRYDPESGDPAPEKLPLTVERWCVQKGLPVEGLAEAAVEIGPLIKKDGKPSDFVHEWRFTYPSGAVHLKQVEKIPDSRGKNIWKDRASDDPSLWIHQNRDRQNPDPGTVYLCEGETDALALGQYGFLAAGIPGSMALKNGQTKILESGEKITTDGLEWLSDHADFERIRVIFDADTAGIKGMAKIRKHAAEKMKRAFEVVRWPREMAGMDVRDVLEDYGPDGVMMILTPDFWADPWKELIKDKPPEREHPGQLFDGDPPEANTIGSARWFIDETGEDIRFIPELKAEPYYVWNPDSNLWFADVNGAKTLQKVRESMIRVHRYAIEQAKDEDLPEHEQKDWKRYANRVVTERHIRDVTILAKSYPEVQAPATLFDSRAELIPFTNGTYDIRARQFTEPNREHYLTRRCSAAYIEDAPEPERWIQFLQEIFGNDHDLIHAMKLFIGYSFTGFATEQSFQFFIGAGKNGKSTLVNTIRQIIGTQYAVELETRVIMTSRYPQNHSTDLARLEGARFVWMKEPKVQDRIDDSIIKQLADQYSMTARAIYQTGREFPNTFTCVCMSNHEPGISHIDDALKRRLILVPFRVVIPESDRDPHLHERLQKEQAGITKWIIDGAVEWYHEHRRSRIKWPDKVIAATESYFAENDSFLSFSDYLLDYNPDLEIPFRMIYIHYRAYCLMNGISPILSIRRVADKLKALIESGTKIHKFKDHDSQIRYVGIGFKKDEYGIFQQSAASQISRAREFYDENKIGGNK